MTETTDVAWTIVVRIEDTDRWIDWSTGHRTVPDVLAAAELIVPVSTIAEIRFDQITTARKRFSLADLGATDAAVPSAPADTDLRERIAQAIFTNRFPTDSWEKQHAAIRNDYRDIADAVLAELPAPTDRADETERLRTKNERMRHELEVMYGGAFDNPKPVPADRAAVPFVPPAADGLPLAALDSATNGASALDAWARDSHGRNFLAHALVQLARDGWLRTESGEGFEPVRDREAPDPEDPTDLLRTADEAQQAEPETSTKYFVYTDADAAHLSIGAKNDGGRPVVSVVADEAQRAAVVYVLLEDIEDVVAALRDARRNAQALHDETQQAGENR